MIDLNIVRRVYKNTRLIKTIEFFEGEVKWYLGMGENGEYSVLLSCGYCNNVFMKLPSSGSAFNLATVQNSHTNHMLRVHNYEP
jgi:hypothetical protein